MSNFTNKLILNSTDQEGYYETTRELVYELGFEGSGIKLTVPEGSPTNLGSVPKVWILQYLYRSITRSNGKYVAATVLHDYMCNEKFEGYKQKPSGFSRFEADAIFRSALKALGAPYWLRLTAYFAVRLNAVFLNRKFD